MHDVTYLAHSFLASVDVDGKLTFSQDLAYQAVGIMAVLGSLASIAVILSVLAQVLNRSKSRKSPAADKIAEPSQVPQVPPVPGAPTAVASTDAPAVVNSSDSSQIPPGVRAAIAAAVHVTLGAGYRVLEISQVSGDKLQIWSMEGRRQIFQSHRVR